MLVSYGLEPIFGQWDIFFPPSDYKKYTVTFCEVTIKNQNERFIFSAMSFKCNFRYYNRQKNKFYQIAQNVEKFSYLLYDVAWLKFTLLS